MGVRGIVQSMESTGLDGVIFIRAHFPRGRSRSRGRQHGQANQTESSELELIFVVWSQALKGPVPLFLSSGAACDGLTLKLRISQND